MTSNSRYATPNMVRTLGEVVASVRAGSRVGPFLVAVALGGWLMGCTTFQDWHDLRVARWHLVQAEADVLHRCATMLNPKLEGLSSCYPPVWPYTEKVGEQPNTNVSLLSGSSLPIVGTLLGLVP